MKSRPHRYVRWLVLAIAGVIGIGMHAAPVAPSPGRWEPAPHRALLAEHAAIADYLVAYPRTGDRISNSLYLALAESEDAWAAMYLDRQAIAVARAADRLDQQRDGDTFDQHHMVHELLEHYRRLIEAGRGGANGFTLLLDDQIGPQLRVRILHSVATDQ